MSSVRLPSYILGVQRKYRLLSFYRRLWQSESGSQKDSWTVQGSEYQPLFSKYFRIYNYTILPTWTSSHNHWAASYLENEERESFYLSAAPFPSGLAIGEYTLHNYVIVQIDDFLMLVDKQREIKSNKVQLLKQQKEQCWGRGMQLRVFQGCWRVGFDRGLGSAPGSMQNKTGAARLPHLSFWCPTYLGWYQCWQICASPRFKLPSFSDCRQLHLWIVAVGITEASSSIF